MPHISFFQLLHKLKNHDLVINSEVEENRGELRTDSRKIQRDDIFLAYGGVNQDGHRFIEKAKDNGAKLIILENSSYLDHCQGVSWILVKNSRRAWSYAAALAYGDPHQALKLYAVTGTNGKTSVATIAAQIFRLAGLKTASLGTLGYEDGKTHIPTDHTTPDPMALFALIGRAKKDKVEHVVMEVSSHAIAQEKIAPLIFDGLVWTNFSQDHLDFHGTMEAYFDCKLNLFLNHSLPDSPWIINAGLDPMAEIFRQNPKTRLYGRGSGHLQFHQDAVDLNCSSVTIETDSQTWHGNVPFGADYAIENFVAAWGLHYFSHGMAASQDVWNQLRSPKGRMQCIHSKPWIFVDYAHTPDALEKSLQILKQGLIGKLWVIFGCGGDRDSTKRPLMGSIAAKEADRVIVTSDNPRTEDPMSIINQITRCFKDDIDVIVDRQKAIFFAVEHITNHDCLLIAGKGHENYQIIGNTKKPFDDSKVALQAINTLKKSSF